jgi:hypothetical protein
MRAASSTSRPTARCVSSLVPIPSGDTRGCRASRGAPRIRRASRASMAPLPVIGELCALRAPAGFSRPQPWCTVRGCDARAGRERPSSDDPLGAGPAASRDGARLPRDHLLPGRPRPRRRRCSRTSRAPSGLFRGPFVELRLPVPPRVGRCVGLPRLRAGRSGPTRTSSRPSSGSRRCTRRQPQHTVVTTGTGSGKTECFLYPILDHCLPPPGEPGIKAILLYPMNALATDQARRLARCIHVGRRRG